VLQDQAGDTSAGGGGSDTQVGGAGDDTVVGAGGQDTVKGAAGGDQVTWPSDWRQRLAADNPDALKTLERFAEPSAMWKSYEAIRQRMSSGELKAHIPFPDKGTAEEQTAWRKDQGVPDKPEAYDTKLDGGLVIGEDDKPMVDKFLAFAHSNHTPNAAVKKTLEWFLGDYRTGVERERAEVEANTLREAEETLRQDWGADYRPNLNAITGLLDLSVSAESPLKARILKSIKLEPEFAKLWANLARQINPVSTLAGIDPARMGSSIDDEIAKIDKTMREDRNAYNKDEKMQARYRELLDARERLKAKAA